MHGFGNRVWHRRGQASVDSDGVLMTTATAICRYQMVVVVTMWIFQVGCFFRRQCFCYSLEIRCSLNVAFRWTFLCLHCALHLYVVVYWRRCWQNWLIVRCKVDVHRNCCYDVRSQSLRNCWRIGSRFCCIDSWWSVGNSSLFVDCAGVDGCSRLLPVKIQ